MSKLIKLKLDIYFLLDPSYFIITDQKQFFAWAYGR